MHLDAGYDSQPNRALLEELGCAGWITPKGKFVPINHTHRWVIERTNSWNNRGVQGVGDRDRSARGGARRGGGVGQRGHRGPQAVTSGLDGRPVDARLARRL